MPYHTEALLLVGLFSLATATNYCSPKLCYPSTSHIACGNDKKFGPHCPHETTRLLVITEDLKDQIVLGHNNKRNLLASGGLKGFPAAVRMATMQWDTELADLAELNAKRCVFQHDTCRNTDRFRHSGQNIFAKWWFGKTSRDDELIFEALDAWWDEYADASVADVARYPALPEKVIGHFTVMAAEKNVVVGCGGSFYPNQGMNMLLFVCNYGTTNIVDRPIYESGASASKCLNGPNSKHRFLCSPKEEYDVNGW